MILFTVMSCLLTQKPNDHGDIRNATHQSLCSFSAAGVIYFFDSRACGSENCPADKDHRAQPISGRRKKFVGNTRFRSRDQFLGVPHYFRDKHRQRLGYSSAFIGHLAYIRCNRFCPAVKGVRCGNARHRVPGLSHRSPR